MRNLLDIAARNSGTPMRHAAYYVTHPDGTPFPMQLAEGRCLVVFGSRERAKEWIGAVLSEPFRSRARIGAWHTLEQAERFMERYGKDFQVVAPNPAPDPNATPMIDPIGTVLQIARQKAGETRG